MIVVVFAVLVVTVLAAFLVTRILALLYAAPRLASVESVLADRAAIVFGAGLRRDGTPSPVLRDRIATAARLYFEGKVEKLLMSGDNRFEDYNEPGAMKAYALELGIPAKDIVLDYAGRRTYDTCYRARDIFRLNSAILVTQAFHLPRALYICNQLGLPAVGVPADQREYRQASRVYWSIRETLAMMAALWEVHVTRPVPVLGDPEPIFPQEAQ
jgi:SanA protein